MLITTYQHDYIAPRLQRYDFLKKDKKTDQDGGDKPLCECPGEAQELIPKNALAKCPKPEWTGVAPMGRLIEPRIIPTKLTKEQREGFDKGNEDDCFRMQPNRFLKILRTVYPDLYERLKSMPKDELSRRLDKQRLFTTYQIDYCNMSEYPEGVYETLKQQDDMKKLVVDKLLEIRGPCSEFRADIMEEHQRELQEGYLKPDPCEKAYKPFKITFDDSSRFVNSGDNSHWRTNNLYNKRPDISEYKDSISRNGCIITRNHLHNHSKCAGGQHCRHEIIYTCAKYR